MDYKYTSIDEERRGRCWPWKRELIAAVLIAALSSMATFGVMTSVKAMQGNAKVHRSQQFSCGETFDEAHQRGCTFDALTLAWLHPKCSQYGAQEFQETSGNDSWQYWEDESGLHELGGYEALSHLPGGSSYWTTTEAHLYHCQWLLLRIHDAATTPGKLLDSKSSSYEHTKHCLDVLVEQARIGVGEKLSQVSANGTLVDIGWTVC